MEDLIPAAPVLSKLSSSFYEQLENAKWQIRKEAVDYLFTLVNDKPKLEIGDYSELNQALLKMLKVEKNVVVLKVAVECFAHLLIGAKSYSVTFAKPHVALLFEMFKDVKLQEPVCMALDAFMQKTSSNAPYTSLLPEIIDEIMVSCKHKVPTVRQ